MSARSPRRPSSGIGQTSAAFAAGMRHVTIWIAVFAVAACSPRARESKAVGADRARADAGDVTRAPVDESSSDAGMLLSSQVPSSETSPTRLSTQPLIRPVRWLCDEQDCEGAPRLAYDYLPAVSADGEHVAIVEERDGWGHTRLPGVRVVNSTTGASERFFPVLVPSVDLKRDLRRKSEYESLLRNANEGLAAYDLRPLFPAHEQTSESAEDAATTAPRMRGRTIARVAGIQIEIWSADQASPSDKLYEIVIRHGAITKRVSAQAWDAQGGCSLRAFRFVGARPDIKVGVFVSEITMTGHNCDGVAEKQPWAVRVVRW